MWTIYILQCRDDSLYTGVTNDLARRLETHRQGKGSRYVRNKSPFTMVLHRDYTCRRSDIQKLERHVKQQSRQQKLLYIRDPGQLDRIMEGIVDGPAAGIAE